MEVTIKVPERLAAQARSQGIPLSTYLEELLTEISQPTKEVSKIPTPAEIGAWLNSLAQFSHKIPPLPDTISRDWIYQDHD